MFRTYNFKQHDVGCGLRWKCPARSEIFSDVRFGIGILLSRGLTSVVSMTMVKPKNYTKSAAMKFLRHMSGYQQLNDSIIVELYVDGVRLEYWNRWITSIDCAIKDYGHQSTYKLQATNQLALHENGTALSPSQKIRRIYIKLFYLYIIIGDNGSEVAFQFVQLDRSILCTALLKVISYSSVFYCTIISLILVHLVYFKTTFYTITHLKLNKIVKK